MLIRSDEHVDLPTPFGSMRTHLFRPVAGRHPGILLFSEIFQVTGPIRRAAALLAGHGYLVSVPEIFHELEGEPGVVLSYDDEGARRGNAHKVTKTLASYDTDARVALDHLAAHPECTGRLGVMGICVGGHLALRAGLQPDVAAAACFYATDLHTHSLGQGASDDTLARVSEASGELLMVWGRQDPHIPAEGRRRIQDALEEAGADFTWHEFNGQHAFLRDEGPRYDAELARFGSDLVLSLFHRRLSA